MQEMLSPGVYVSEVDSSSYISDTSTCIVGCVGEARRGPVGVPTLVTSQKDLINMFGAPTEGMYGIYSALQMLENVSQLYYVRVVRSATKAKAGKGGEDKILFKAYDVGTSYNGIVIEQSNIENNKFNITVKNQDGEEVEKFEDLTTITPDVNYVETVINGTSTYISVEVAESGEIREKTFTLGGAVDSGSYAVAGNPETDKLTFRSKFIDSTLNGGTVQITEPDVYGYFNVIVRDSKKEDVESWTAVTLDLDDERYIEEVINKNSNRIQVEINDILVDLEGDTLVFHGGEDGISGMSADDYIGEADGIGIHALDNAELLTIDVIAVPGKSEAKIINAAIEVAESRGDAIYVADTPFGLSASQVVAWSNGEGNFTDHQAFNTSYGAFYWPWVKVSDSAYTKKNIWLPPSGFVIARYAYNDKVSNPWNAPAGLNRGRIAGALGVEKSPTKGERDAVYGNRNIINPIANFQAEGLVIWGQKTMQRKPTALDRINVRRLINYIKRTVGNATRYYIFEANNSSTWTDWKTVVNPILSGIKNSGGVYEYKLTIQPTAEDIENNRMPVKIYVKPTKTAEFIPITINIMNYSASFSNVD